MRDGAEGGPLFWVCLPPIALPFGIKHSYWILNLKSSSPERRNFHGCKVPFEYTMEMTIVLYMLGKAMAARHYTHWPLGLHLNPKPCCPWHKSKSGNHTILECDVKCKLPLSVSITHLYETTYTTQDIPLKITHNYRCILKSNPSMNPTFHWHLLLVWQMGVPKGLILWYLHFFLVISSINKLYDSWGNACRYRTTLHFQ
jgi:hypothetical protein